jgi:hypothetical protein
MTTAATMRDLYLAAEQDILSYGTSNRFGDRILTTADLPDIRRGRQEWERRAASEESAAAGRHPLQFSVARFD